MARIYYEFKEYKKASLLLEKNTNEITIENFTYLIMLTNIDIYIWVGLIGIAV